MIYDTMNFSILLTFGGKPHNFNVQVVGQRESLNDVSIIGIKNFGVETLKDLIVGESTRYYQQNKRFDTDVILGILVSLFEEVKKQVGINIKEYSVQYLGFRTVLEVNG